MFSNPTFQAAYWMQQGAEHTFTPLSPGSGYEVWLLTCGRVCYMSPADEQIYDFSDDVLQHFYSMYEEKISSQKETHLLPSK